MSSIQYQRQSFILFVIDILCYCAIKFCSTTMMSGNISYMSDHIIVPYHSHLYLYQKDLDIYMVYSISFY